MGRHLIAWGLAIVMAAIGVAIAFAILTWPVVAIVAIVVGVVIVLVQIGYYIADGAGSL